MLILPPGAEYAGRPRASSRRSAGATPSSSSLPAWLGGSNNWVLAGSRTASGRPLLAGDPHRPLDTPNCYYQNHLACPDFDAIGLSFPGVPGMSHFGHNRHVAWCVTHAMADYQDVFVERFDPDRPDAVRVPRRVAAGRGAARDDPGPRRPRPGRRPGHRHAPRAGDPRRSRRAATPSRSATRATAEPNPTFDALVPMLRATSAARSRRDAAVGRSGQQPGVRRRPRGDRLPGPRTPARAGPRRTAGSRWRAGTAPTSGRARSLSKRCRRSAIRPRAGSPPPTARIVGADYPHYLGLDYAPDFRTRRIVARLQDLRDATVADMAAIHADRASIPARRLVELLAGSSPRRRLPRGARDAARLGRRDGRRQRRRRRSTRRSGRAFVHDVLRPVLGPLASDAFARAPSAAVSHVARLRGRLAEWIRETTGRSSRPATTGAA